jgi:hypothetical protein
MKRLPFEEWKFSSLDNSHYEECFAWEYSREIPCFVEKVSSLRSEGHNISGHYRSTDSLIDRILYQLVGINEWPKTPYLALDFGTNYEHYYKYSIGAELSGSFNDMVLTNRCIKIKDSSNLQLFLYPEIPVTKLISVLKNNIVIKSNGLGIYPRDIKSVSFQLVGREGLPLVYDSLSFTSKEVLLDFLTVNIHKLTNDLHFLSNTGSSLKKKIMARLKALGAWRIKKFVDREESDFSHIIRLNSYLEYKWDKANGLYRYESEWNRSETIFRTTIRNILSGKNIYDIVA